MVAEHRRTKELLGVRKQKSNTKFNGNSHSIEKQVFRFFFARAFFSSVVVVAAADFLWYLNKHTRFGFVMFNLSCRFTSLSLAWHSGLSMPLMIRSPSRTRKKNLYPKTTTTMTVIEAIFGLTLFFRILFDWVSFSFVHVSQALACFAQKQKTTTTEWMVFFFIFRFMHMVFSEAPIANVF